MARHCIIPRVKGFLRLVPRGERGTCQSSGTRRDRLRAVRGRNEKRCKGLSMYADAVSKISESIFPIFFAYEQDDRVTMGVSGTGFFVEESGLFVTVEHIMTCAPADSTYYYYGKLPDQVCQPAVEIEHVASDPARDLYLGRVRRDDLQPVVFSSEPVRPGDYVCLSG